MTNRDPVPRSNREDRPWADEGRVERVRRERQALLDEVSAATGLAGRRRRVGSTNERARVAVRKAIAATLDRVKPPAAWAVAGIVMLVVLSVARSSRELVALEGVGRPRQEKPH